MKSNWVIYSLIIIAVVAGVLLYLRGGDKTEENAIRIGIAGPITGPYAKFGEQLLIGVEALAEKINADGGINGRPIEIVQGDDACEAKQARSVANRMVGDGVHAVIGHFCSSSTIPASEVYAEHNLLMITPASTNPQVTDRGLDTIFRACFRDDQQGNFAADYIAEKLNPQAIAVIHDKDTYGQGLADATRARLQERYGITEVLYEGVTRGDKDFNSLVTKMKGLGVDVIYFGGLHTEAALIVRQAREQGLDAIFVSGDGLITQEFAELAGTAADGVLMTFAANPADLPEAQAAVEEIRARGDAPEGWTLYSYLALQVVKAAIEANGGSADGALLADYIHNNAIDTIMGTQEWDANGDPKVAPIAMYRWEPDENGMMTYTQIDPVN